MNPNPTEIAELIQDWQAGHQEALDALMPLVYDQLRLLANYHLKREAPGHSLRATELVHEAYMKLLASNAAIGDQAHFYALASRIIRHMLVNYGKAKRTQKRGGGALRLPLQDEVVGGKPATVEFVEFDQALDRLAAIDPRKARLVELTFFGGMEQEQAAKAVGISPATVRRELRLAKAFLYQELVLHSQTENDKE
jgi:RNA polymerase sigma-70 factor (ECF subfamily)